MRDRKTAHVVTYRAMVIKTRSFRDAEKALQFVGDLPKGDFINAETVTTVTESKGLIVPPRLEIGQDPDFEPRVPSPFEITQ